MRPSPRPRRATGWSWSTPTRAAVSVFLRAGGHTALPNARGRVVSTASSTKAGADASPPASATRARSASGTAATEGVYRAATATSCPRRAGPASRRPEAQGAWSAAHCRPPARLPRVALQGIRGVAQASQNGGASATTVRSYSRTNVALSTGSSSTRRCAVLPLSDSTSTPSGMMTRTYMNS